MGTKLTKKEQEGAVRHYEDILDNTLYAVLEIAKLPTKWGMDLQGNMLELFPHPIVNRESTKVTGIVYKPYKNYMLPELLLDRLAVLEDEIAKANSKSIVEGKTKVIKHFKCDIELVREWVELREQGLTYLMIGDKYGLKHSIINYQVKKYKKAQEAQ